MNLTLGTVFEILETAGLDPYHIETSPLIYIDLRSRSMDWFLYDNGLRRERVKESLTQILQYRSYSNVVITWLSNNCNSIFGHS